MAEATPKIRRSNQLCAAGVDPVLLDHMHSLAGDVADDAPRTISEFEKQLIAKGIAHSRRHARHISSAAKAAGHLFCRK